MEHTRRIYNSDYSIAPDGKIYKATKTGKQRLIKSFPIETKKSDGYIAVRLNLQSEGSGRTAQIAVKKIVADHFPIHIMSKYGTIKTPEYIENAAPSDLGHIDGDIYNCAVDNIFYYDGGKPKESVGYVSKRRLFHIVDLPSPSDGAKAPAANADTLAPAADNADTMYDIPFAPNNFVTTSGNVYSFNRSSNAELIRTFRNNANDKHLSVRLTTDVGERKRFLVPEVMLKTFYPKEMKKIDGQVYHIFYRDGNSNNCALDNLVMGVKISPEQTRVIRKEMMDMSDENQKIVLKSYNAIEA